MSYERLRNARIESELEDRLDNQQIPVFPGVPYALLTGSNPAFVIDNTIRVLPFDTVLINSPEMIQDGQVNVKYSMLVSSEVILYVAATVTGSATRRAYVYVNGVEVRSKQATQDPRVGDDIVDSLTLKITQTGVVVDLRAQSTKNLTIDMTKSKWGLMRLSVDPNLIDNSRLTG